MNTSTHYHPLQSAARAAWGELTTDEALTWYQDKVWADLLTTYAVARQLCLLTIQLGAIARLWCDTLVPISEQTDEQTSQEQQASLPARVIAGYLPECSSVMREVLVTPASTNEAPTLTVLTTETTEVNLAAMTIRELRGLARKVAIRGYGQMSKAQLIETLAVLQDVNIKTNVSGVIKC
jgi:hypothetical protein